MLCICNVYGWMFLDTPTMFIDIASNKKTKTMRESRTKICCFLMLITATKRAPQTKRNIFKFLSWHWNLNELSLTLIQKVSWRFYHVKKVNTIITQTKGSRGHLVENSGVNVQKTQRTLLLGKQDGNPVVLEPAATDWPSLMYLLYEMFSICKCHV